MSETAVRGLTTVALLKVNYDANLDHFDLYMPFVLDTLCAWPGDGFSAEEVRVEVAARHNLQIPVEATRTILNRIRKRGHLRREGGRFFRNAGKPIAVDVTPQRQAIEREHRAVAHAFIEFARGRGVEVADEVAALSLILGFLETNEVQIISDPQPEKFIAAAEQQLTKELRVTALFIHHAFDSQPNLVEYIERMLQGLVLQNALLLGNVNLKRRQFRDLEVFFDTRFLFRAIGLAGEPYVAAAREELTVLRTANATTSVFATTIDEMRRVLAFVQGRIGTPSGVRELRPYELVRHALTKRYRPSDIAEASALLERNLHQLGFVIRESPKRIPQFTLDEGQLSKRLMRPDQTEIDPRVDHDVNVAAAVLTYRGSRTPTSLDDARAIFSTPTGEVVEKIRRWYFEQKKYGIPPVIHQTALSHVAWLKNPADAKSSLTRHELVMLCAAVLRPTAEMWRRFTSELRRLQQAGTITSDEEVALLTSQLTDARLAEARDEDDIDAETVTELVERLRAEHMALGRGDTEAAVRQVEADWEKRVAVVERVAKEDAEGRAAALEQVQVSEEARRKSEESRRQLTLQLHGRIRLLARIGSGVIYSALGLVVVAGIILGLPGVAPASSSYAKVIGLGVLVIFGILNFVDLHIGWSVAELRRRLENVLVRKLTAWWFGAHGPDREAQ